MSGTFVLFLWSLSVYESVAHVRTVAVNTLVMFEIFYLFSSRSIYGSAFARESFIKNRFAPPAVELLVLFQLAFTYLSPMQHLFGTVAIDTRAWLLIICLDSSVLFLVEIEKMMLRRKLGI
jgi:magnesium-transporting ATPase (P-type)